MPTCSFLMHPLIWPRKPRALGDFGSERTDVLIAIIGHWNSEYDALHTGAFHGVWNSEIFGPWTGVLQCDNKPYLKFEKSTMSYEWIITICSILANINQIWRFWLHFVSSASKVFQVVLHSYIRSSEKPRWKNGTYWASYCVSKQGVWKISYLDVMKRTSLSVSSMNL